MDALFSNEPCCQTLIATGFMVHDAVGSAFVFFSKPSIRKSLIQCSVLGSNDRGELLSLLAPSIDVGGVRHADGCLPWSASLPEDFS